MTLDEALDYIHSVDWRGSVPGLSRIDALMNKLGHPERTLRCIHVTGTNGKGSTCAMISAVLRAAGYRVGLYTSPYIRVFNERMQLGGVPIPDDELCALVEEIRPLASRMDDPPTEFELVTALALTWFARQQCDIVVCEVGMGGEFDATNVIPAPEVAAVTNIGLDHTAVLGGTIEAIAATKAGIIKPGCDAVLYPSAPSVRKVVTDRCRTVGAALTVADFDALRPRSHSLSGQVFDWPGLPGLRLSLLGQHQLHNAAVTLTVLTCLRRRGWNIPETAIRSGLAAVEWPGRFQLVRRDPAVILDGGHNPQCMEALTRNVDDYLSARPLTVLTGVLGDKDYGHMYGQLARRADRFVTVTPRNPRALSADKLAETLSALGKPVTACERIPQGVKAALALTPPDGAVLCCGSLYLLGDVMSALEAI